MGAMDFYSQAEHWDARLPERDVVTLVSKFTLGDVINQTCLDLSDVSRRSTSRYTTLPDDELEEDIPPIKRSLPARLKAFSLDAIPAVGFRRMTPRVLRTMMPRILANQPKEICCSGDFTGPMVLHVDYPTQLDETFSIRVQVDFRFVLGQIVTQLLKGLPYTYEYCNNLVGNFIVALQFPYVGSEDFSASLILKDRSFYKVVEEAVKQRQEDIKSSVPAKVESVKVGTETKFCDGEHWRCVNKIRMRVKPMR